MPPIQVSIEAYSGLIGEITKDTDRVAEELTNASVPFGIIAGAASPIPWRQAARETAELSPRAFLDVVPNAGRFIWLDAPGRVLAAAKRLRETAATR